MTLLHDEILGSAGTFDVSGISGSYAHLLICLNGRGSVASNQAEIRVRFNNDSGNNYNRQIFAGEGGSVGAGSSTSQAYIQLAFMPAASSTASMAAGFTMQIPDYSNAVFNKLIYSSGYSTHGGGGSSYYFGAGVWLSTAAITRIQIFPDSGNFVTGSRLTIYGLGE